VSKDGPPPKRFRLDDSRVTLDGPVLTREEEEIVTPKRSFA